MQADVIVAGAGPAGSAAALTLARQGRRVLLFERAALPQPKACGDLLLSDALQALERFGVVEPVRAAGLAVPKLRLESPSGFEVDLAIEAVTLRRQQLHAILHRSLISAGVELHQGEVISPLCDLQGRTVGARVRIDGRDVDVSAPLTILATGARPETLKRFNVCLRETPTVVAIRTYYRARHTAIDEMLRICYHQAVAPGYGWLFPLPEHQFNVGLGHFLVPGERADQLYLQRRLEFLTRAFQPACQVAAEDDQLGPPCGWILRTGLTGTQRYAPGVMVVGEAVGSTSPLIGDGVGKALESGEIAGEVALEALAAGSFGAEFLSRYGERLDDRFDLLFRSRLKVEKSLRSPERLDLLIRKASRSTTLREGLEGIINRNLPPTDVITFWKLLFA